MFPRDLHLHPFDVSEKLLNRLSDLLSDLWVLVRQGTDDLLSFIQFNLQVLVALEFLIDGQRLLGNVVRGALIVLQPLFVEGILLVEFIQLKVDLLTQVQPLFEVIPMAGQFVEQPIDVGQLKERRSSLVYRIVSLTF